MIFMWCGQLRKHSVCMRPTLKFIIIIITTTIIRHELGLHRPVSTPLNFIHKMKNKHTYNYMHDFTRLFFYNHEQFKHTANNKENLLKMKFTS